MFENTVALIVECGLTHLHVFPYSARQGTPAARMPQLPGQVIRERAARLREAGATLRRAWLAGQIGHTAAVLIERDGSGRSEHYARVRFPNRNEPGTVLAARITGASDDGLTGEVVQP
jgi:threonylcarbamoyladenosine tRNA methylthiotransferase MtaB